MARRSESETSTHYISEADLFRKVVKDKLTEAQAARGLLLSDKAELTAQLTVVERKLTDWDEVIRDCELVLGTVAPQIEGQ